LSLFAPRAKHYYTDHISRPWPLPPQGSWLARRLKRLLLWRYRRAICVSRFVQDCLSDRRPWAGVQTCLHFINTDRFHPDLQARGEVRHRFGAEEAFVILAVAHLIPEKGLDVACRALAELPPRAVLWVAGSGPAHDALNSLCASLGIADRVRLLGNQAEVQPFMQAADCLVCPSVWAEAAGLVNLEAQAVGLPVVASRIGGIPEYVADGTTGLFFSPGNPTELAHCLRRLMDDPELCQGLGEQARAAAVERFSVQRRLAEYLNLYR
jgi:phosphatidylinositol alpha-1,6-mannosyltransferase